MFVLTHYIDFNSSLLIADNKLVRYGFLTKKNNQRQSQDNLKYKTQCY